MAWRQFYSDLKTKERFAHIILCSRRVFLQWHQQSKNIAFTSQMVKAELLELCKRNKTAPLCEVNEMLRKHGHCNLTVILQC